MKSETPEKNRLEIAEGLRGVLADTYALHLKAQNYHWNVESMEFPFLHELFEGQYRDLLKGTDEIAGRIRALGFYIPTRHSELVRGSAVQEETEVPDSREMIQNLLEGHGVAVQTIRALLPLSQKSQDEATAKVLADRLLVHEKAIWMLGSCLKSKGGSLDGKPTLKRPPHNTGVRPC